MNNRQKAQDKEKGKGDMLSIDELLKQRQERLERETASSGHTYTTSDEIAFILQLKREGKFQVLRNLRKIYQHRDWSGKGMEVNGDTVMLYITRIVGPQPALEQAEEYEQFARRKSFAHFSRLGTLAYQQQRAKDQARQSESGSCSGGR